MTLYEIRLKNAQNEDKIIYYDYLLYKRAAGWWTSFINDDWNRPTKIKRARYNADFLQKIPDYYFLGIPIKELIKSTSSEGHCHACTVALSLCFNDFDIVTCNLKSYNEYYNSKTNSNDAEYEHTILVIDVEDRKIVIDTTFGIITDFKTYEYIFSIKNVRRISSEEIKNTEIYKFIESKKNIKGPSKESEYKEDDEYKKYSKEIQEYMDMCKSYKNEKNKHLQDFFNRCLFRTSNSSSVWNWRCNLEFKSCNCRFVYPTINLFSLVDDEFDNNLYSENKATIERNNKVLENYHKPQQSQSKISDIKNKLLKLACKLGFDR